MDVQGHVAQRPPGGPLPFRPDEAPGNTALRRASAALQPSFPGLYPVAEAVEAMASAGV